MKEREEISEILGNLIAENSTKIERRKARLRRSRAISGTSPAKIIGKRGNLSFEGSRNCVSRDWDRKGLIDNLRVISGQFQSRSLKS